MKTSLKRVASIAWLTGIALVGTVRLALELIGYVSVPEDAQRAYQIVDPLLRLTLAVPVWLLVAAIAVTALASILLLRARKPSKVSLAIAIPNEQVRLRDIAAELQKSRSRISGFQTRVDKGSLVGRPFEQLRRLAQEHKAVLRTLEKQGFAVPYLDVSVDPIGFMETAIEHVDAVVPLLRRDHIEEARVASARLVAKFSSFQASQAGF